MPIFKVYNPGTANVRKIEADQFDYNHTQGIYIFSDKDGWVGAVSPAPGTIIVNAKNEGRE